MSFSTSPAPGLPPSSVAGSRVEELLGRLAVELCWAPPGPSSWSDWSGLPSHPPGSHSPGSVPSERSVVEFVRACAQGRVSLGDLPRLAGIDPMGLDDAARVDLIEAFERVRAQVDGAQQRALASVIAATEAAGLDGDAARHEIGAALRLSPVTAYARTRVAAQLVGRLPGSLGALSAGEISYLQAKVLAEAVADLPELPTETVAVIEAKVLAVAPEQTLAQTRRTVARAVIAADPTSAQQRHEQAAKTRSVQRHRLPDAMAGWWVTMPAPAEAAAWETLTRLARATQSRLRADGLADPDLADPDLADPDLADPDLADPGMDALRVDTLIEVLLDRATPATGAPRPGPAPGPRPGGQEARPAGGPAGGTTTPGRAESSATEAPPGRVPRCRCGGAQTAAVVVDLPTALGLAQNPGTLPGYGPIPPALARAMAQDRDWVRWTVDPGTRHLIDRGDRRYRPAGRLRAYIAAAAGTCGFPGCARPAQQCDTDHRTTFARGGPTAAANLGPLCRTHHNAKTHGRWQVTRDPDTHTLTWTSPLGRRYTQGTDPPLQ